MEPFVVWSKHMSILQTFEISDGSAVPQLLRPVYPGQFHNVKQNLFNVVIVADLSQTTALHFITNTMNMIIQRGFPFRFGVVPISETEAGQ